MTNWKSHNLQRFYQLYGAFECSVHCFMVHNSTVSFHAQHFHQRHSEPLASEEVWQNHCERHAKHQKLVFTWWTRSIQQTRSQIFPSGVCGKQENLYWTDRSASYTTPYKCPCFWSDVCRTHIIIFTWQVTLSMLCVTLVSSDQALMNADCSAWASSDGHYRQAVKRTEMEELLPTRHVLNHL